MSASYLNFINHGPSKVVHLLLLKCSMVYLVDLHVYQLARKSIRDECLKFSVTRWLDFVSILGRLQQLQFDE